MPDIMRVPQRGVKGCRKFLERVWKLSDLLTPEEEYSAELRTKMHQTIKKVSLDFEAMNYNTAIAAMMALVNEFYRRRAVTRGELRTLLQLLNPVAPHMTEEMWEESGFGGRLYDRPWPQYREELTKEETVEIAFQMNGKTRGTVAVPAGASKEEMLAAAKEAFASRLEGLTIVKEIVVPGRIVNLVVKG